ncbi:MAG: extracellular solute-binding protein [Lachnospiraceae bacterium]|nr:extracellular solute-binding protein [Lachnospiraceae bacterium]
MKTKRLLALLMAVIMLFTCLAGCGKTHEDGVNGTDGTLSKNVGEDGTDSQLADGNIAMGRYVEEVTDFTDNRISGSGSRLHRLSDGRIVLSDNYSSFLISDDNGATWKGEDRKWRSRLNHEGKMPSEIAIGADNTAAVIYNDSSDKKEARHNFNGQTLRSELLVIRPDDTESLIDIPVSGDNKYPKAVGITDKGRIFVSISNSSDLYEVKEDGSCEYFMTVQGESPVFMQLQGNLMFLEVPGYEPPLIYDMEKKEYVEDEVLADFIRENYFGGNKYNISGKYQIYFFPGEEGVIYIAGEKGLHRHVIGGSAMEQIIDGSLCTFSNPSYGLTDMIMLEDNAFLALFTEITSYTGARLVRYVYDPEVTTVPDDRLKVYSLKENDTIRQAIAVFMAAYPGIAVEYEIGMEKGSSVTREDALKKLNTRIMAGDGPDVLILDDMPLDSYIEKGILLDLSTILGSLSGEEEIFDSIVQTMKKDDKVCAFPCEINIPVMMGAKKYISQLKDLESIADVMEELRKDNPGKDLLNICTEKGIMRYFAITCVPAWITERGELDREAITQFLKQTKRIYDVQMDGLPEEIIEEYQWRNDSWLEAQGVSKDDHPDFRALDNVIFYYEGSIQLSYSALSRAVVYDMMASVDKVEGFEGSKWTVMNGQSSNVFCARTLLGINAASENPGSAQNFIRLCLGREMQSNLYYGLAVNKAAFDENFIIPENTERYIFLDSKEEEIKLTINEKQIADLRKCIEAVDTVYIEDTVLENAVYEEGIRYMQGELSLEEAVNAIEKKISIYMAE